MSASGVAAEIRGLHRDVRRRPADHLAVGAGDGQIDVGQVAAVVARARHDHRVVVLLDLDLAVVGIVGVTGDHGIHLGVDLHDHIGEERIGEIAAVDRRSGRCPIVQQDNDGFESLRVLEEFDVAG